MDWTFLFMMLALKIPLGMLIWLVWWAIKQQPEVEDEPAPGGDGGARVRPRHPRFPRRPRYRGPHGEPLPASPPRVRTVVARSGVRER
ncbi:MAG: hypothetical protein JWQ48_3777 [Conexibacter sp.]|jgi:hypothetical protein|nr:hypothetical protein [Conexibacter sp.]